MASYYDTELENQNKTRAVNIALPILAALEAVGTSIATKGRNPTSNALGLYKDVQSAREAALERAIGRDKSAADAAREDKILAAQQKTSADNAALTKRRIGMEDAEFLAKEDAVHRAVVDKDRLKTLFLGTPSTTDEATNTVTMGRKGLFPDATAEQRAQIEADPQKFAFQREARDPLQDFMARWNYQISNPKPTSTSKTPEQIEAEAAARARGAASVPKVLSAEDQNVVKMKLASLGTARRQLAAVKAAAKAANESMLSGKGRGWIPTKENAAFEKATAALKPTIQAMTRVPGVGAMSDFESRLAMAPYPEPGEYGEVNEQAIAGLESLINEIEGGYRGMSGGGVTGKPVTPRQGAAPAAADPRKALAQQALNDPEATEQEKAAARKILGMP